MSDPELFVTNEKDGLHIITLPPILDHRSVSKFEAAVKNWLATEFPLHIFDLKHVIRLQPTSYRPFFSFQKELKLQQKQLKSLNVPKSLAPRLKEDGLLKIISPIRNIEEASALLRNSATQEKVKIDVEFINPFIEATKNFFKIQANLDVIAEKPVLKPSGEFNSFHIGGQIKIQNDRFAGSVVIYFRREVFFRMAERLMGDAFNKHSLDVAASAGEFLNIIFGQAKATLNEKLNLGIEQSLPSILVGEDYRIHEKIPAVVIPFQSAFGKFFLEIGFVNNFGKTNIESA